MSWAINEKISTDPLPGGIPITDQQYAAALAAIPEGKIVSIDGGFKLIDPPQPEPDPEPEPGPPSIDDVAAERDRRLRTGFFYDFQDARGVHQLGTTDADMRRWMDEVTPLAQAMINIGQPEGTIEILTNTGPAEVTAMEWQHILIAAGNYRQPLYAASFGLQAMDPIPADYATNPAYWPPETAPFAPA